MTANITLTTQTAPSAAELKAMRLAYRSAQDQQKGRLVTQAQTSINQQQAPIPTQVRSNIPVSTQQPRQAQTQPTQTSLTKRLIAGPKVSNSEKEIVGNVGTRAKTNTLTSGTKVTRISIAVRQTEYDADGTLVEKRSTNPQEDTSYVTWYRVSVWNENGENDILEDNIKQLEQGQEVRVKGSFAVRPFPSTRNPGQMMTSNEIRCREFDFLLRFYTDGQLFYEAYNLYQHGVVSVINQDAENRFNRQMNRMESYERRLAEKQIGDIQPVTMPLAIQTQPEPEVDEFENLGIPF